MWTVVQRSVNLCLVTSRFFELHRLGVYSDVQNCRPVILIDESRSAQKEAAVLHIYLKALHRDSHEKNDDKIQKEEQITRPRLEPGTF